MSKKLTREEIATELRTANAAYVKLTAEAVDLRLKVRTLEFELAAEHEELLQSRLAADIPAIRQRSFLDKVFGRY